MPRGPMSPEHKEALARGRRQGKVVRDYLEALSADGRRGRPVDRQALERRVQQLQAEIDQETDPLRRVELIQQRLDAEQRLSSLEKEVDLEALEREFVEVAKDYSERRGITYSAWREAGVPASVLRQAGIPRTRRVSGSDQLEVDVE